MRHPKKESCDPGNTMAVPRDELLSPSDVEHDYRIPENTQAVWRCNNRYGFRELVIKIGSRVRYKRSKIDAWIDSRQLASGGDS